MTYELDAAFTRACADPEVRVIALRAAGDHFSSGHDLGSRKHLNELSQPPVYETGIAGDYEKWSELDVEMCLKWRNLRKPLIAGVQGYCIYHGLAVASCADLVVSSSDAKLMPGLVEYNSLPWDTALDVRRAKEVLFLQRFVLPEEALSMGLVSRIVPREQLDSELMRLCTAIAQSDSFYLRLAKRMCNSAAASAGLETHVRDSLSHWTAYRWGWHQQHPGALTADHGGKVKSLAPVAQANEPESMYWSETACLRGSKL
eukprot:TRINITY_DN35931_c0_g2_i1.p1 TRINITY_DN35931_c0_g2~~TRINITY_DN35931_c0_g2_i1.p1  ORF type:complete len:259 (-),score=53.96 TRINITY_DN35931_c0_g2_i1:195-971(-)